jgi:hypothetical protein
VTYAGEGLLQYAGHRHDVGRPEEYEKAARRAERGEGFDSYRQLVPLFDHLEDSKNVELLIWAMNQDDPVRVDPELKAKVDALNNPKNLVPGTNTTKTCRYVEAAFLWRVKTTHNGSDN